jgi:hypothetical protein
MMTATGHQNCRCTLSENIRAARFLHQARGAGCGVQRRPINHGDDLMQKTILPALLSAAIADCARTPPPPGSGGNTLATVVGTPGTWR